MLQLQVRVDAETVSIEWVVNAVQLLVQLLLRSHEHMGPLPIYSTLREQVLFDLSSIRLHRHLLVLAGQEVDEVGED